MPRLALLACIFGLLTIVSGGSVLFGPKAVGELAGEVVSFVLWFNFLAGFLYLLAALGLWRGERWAVRLAGLIALLSFLVLAALGIHIALGGIYEPRTPLAMGFRTLVWIMIYLYARRILSSGARNS